MGKQLWKRKYGNGLVYLSKQNEDGKYVYILKQPGGIIEATVVKENGKTVECKMGGPVSVSLEKTVEVKV